MRIPKLTRLACLAALAGGLAPGLHSQQTEFGPYKFDLKIRLGFYNGDLQQTKFDNKIIGFGFQARREIFGPGSAIAAELSWEHIPSRWHNLIDFKTHNQLNVDDPSIPAGTYRKLSLHPLWSYDGRKESARGISLALSYHSKMPSGFGWQPLDQALDNTEWYAGIRFDRYKVFSEFKWMFFNMSTWPEITPTYNPSGTPPPYTVGGNGAFHEEGANLAPGVFVGLRHTINEDFAFECGLRYFGTKHWDMTPGVYYGEANYRMKTGTSYGPGIEFALVCKL